MLTQQGLRLFFGVLRTACYCFVIPYDFSYTTSKLDFNFRPTTSVLKRRFTVFKFGVCVFNAGFTTFRLSQMATMFLEPEPTQAVPLEDLVLGFFFVLIRFFHLMVPATLGSITGQFASFVNRQSLLNSGMGKLAKFHKISS